MNELGRDDANTVFFRETAAQHWNHTDIGYFDDAQHQESNGTCIPISDSTPGTELPCIYRLNEFQIFVTKN